jgi:hypothetical protein
MIKRMTGGGELSRKLLTVLLMCGSATSWAVDNSIYIDQSGDNAVVTITQDGAGNRVNGIVSNNAGQSTDAAKIYGDGNIVTVNQVGAGNKLSLGIDRGTGTATAANNINYSVTGNNATAYIDLNNNGSAGAAGNAVTITQTGDGTSSRLAMVGDSNVLNLVTSGGANNSFQSSVTGNSNSQTLNVTGGGGNSVATSQTGDGNTINVTSVGATNSMIINQADGGHSATINNNGSGNQFVINQSGTAGANILNTSVAGNGVQIITTQTNR